LRQENNASKGKVVEPKIITEIKRDHLNKTLDQEKRMSKKTKEEQQELIGGGEFIPTYPAPPQQTMESAIIELVQRKDIDPERLEKFLDMQERMEDRQANKALTAALSAFQRDCPIINKTKKAHNSTYAPLDEIVHVIKPILAKHGLSFNFNTKKSGDTTSIITTTIRHVEGGIYQSEYEYLSADDGGKMNSAQKLKSALTYARRAAIELALGLVTQEEDDDAKRAVGNPITDNQIVIINDLMVATDTTPESLYKYLRIESLDSLSVIEADNAISVLKQKRKALVNKGDKNV
jgi:hypothetical protein